MVTLAIPTDADAPAVYGPLQGQWTYADWERLPDDGNRYEIIDGVIYMTTAPSTIHQWIALQLVRRVAIPAEDQGLAYSFFAPIGVLMPGCDPVQPDFVVVLSSKAAIIRDRRVRGVPDLLVEILSRGNAPYDREVKLAAYARAGVPEYAIVDPRARTLSHYQLGTQGAYDSPRGYSAAEALSFACLPTITFTVGDLFAGAPDTTL